MHDMNSVMARRNSMQHVPFMDFSFFPVREEQAPPMPPTSALVSPQPHQLQTSGIDVIPIHVVQSHPTPFRRPQTLYDFEAARRPIAPSAVSSLTAASMDNSEHSVSSKSLVSASESSSSPSANLNANADSQRFKPFHEEKWSLRHKELLQFHKSNGHSAVPHTYPKNPQLARWVKRQRRQFKLRKEGRPSTMTTERLELLDSVGFIWDSHDLNWREKLEALTCFRREKGHCNVPSNFRDKKLATWVKCQRRQYKLYWDGKPSAMSLNRIAALEKVGFEWEIRAASGSSKSHHHAATAATPIPLEEDPLPVHVTSTIGTGEQMFLAKAIAGL